MRLRFYKRETHCTSHVDILQIQKSSRKLDIRGGMLRKYCDRAEKYKRLTNLKTKAYIEQHAESIGGVVRLNYAIKLSEVL